MWKWFSHCATQVWPISVDEAIPSFDVAWYHFGGDVIECHIECDQPSKTPYRLWIVAMPADSDGTLIRSSGVMAAEEREGVVKFAASDWKVPADSMPLIGVRWAYFVTASERKVTAWGAMHGRFAFHNYRDFGLLFAVAKYLVGPGVWVRCLMSIALLIVVLGVFFGWIGIGGSDEPEQISAHLERVVIG